MLINEWNTRRAACIMSLYKKARAQKEGKITEGKQ